MSAKRNLRQYANREARHSEVCAWRFGRNAVCDCGLDQKPGGRNAPAMIDAGGQARTVREQDGDS